MTLHAIWNVNATYILLGFLIEFFLNYPVNFPHPVVFFGKGINLMEWLFYVEKDKPKKKKIKGFITVLLLLFFVYTFFGIFSLLFDRSLFGFFFNLIFTVTIVATGSLIRECKHVLNFLEKNDIEGARNQLSMLVTRDTQGMDEEEICRTTIETLAENFCDGVVAPLFYLFIGGVPLGMTFKMISTLDSMIGYKNERYVNFGWAAAKLDDIAVWIPARISAFFIFIATIICNYNLDKSLSTWQRDKRKTESPNSGHPESAFAGALDIGFGGKVNYFGKTYEKPAIGDLQEKVTKEHVLKAIKLAKVASFTAVIAMAFFEELFRFF